jgi:hypothetical protein
MLLEQEFLIVWLIYLGASVVFLFFWFLLTKPIPNPWIRMFFRAPAFALLFMPLHIPSHNMVSEHIYTPAIASLAIDVVAGHLDQASYVLPYLLASVLVCYVFGFLYVYCFGNK